MTELYSVISRQYFSLQEHSRLERYQTLKQSQMAQKWVPSMIVMV